VSGPVTFPTLAAECGDTERRSLLKISQLLFDQQGGSNSSQLLGSIDTTLKSILAQLSEPPRTVDFVFATGYGIPANKDMYDISAYNPTDSEVYIQIFLSPSAPNNGQVPSFQVHSYPHQVCYYETNIQQQNLLANQRIWIGVSDSDQSLVQSTKKVFLAVERSV
jgi:hypothetical protein